MVLRCKNYKDKLIKKKHYSEHRSDNPSLNDKQMDIPSNEENVDDLLEKFVIYGAQVFELSKKIAMTATIEEVEEEKVLNIHTYLKGRETAICELESHISQNNVEVEELKQSLQSTIDSQYLTDARCQSWGKIISQKANF